MGRSRPAKSFFNFFQQCPLLGGLPLENGNELLDARHDCPALTKAGPLFSPPGDVPWGKILKN